ncbi:MAG: glycosyltransferase [archaeon]|nr:glycosyltransferase [archaeon]
MPPQASVVTVSKDRKELLSKEIDALIAQDYPKNRFEIIVVDDASQKDDLKALVEEKKKKFQGIVYLRQPPSGPAAGRNLGAKNSGSPIILFTDNDCIPRPGWVREMVAAFSDKNVVCVEGKIETDFPRRLFTNAPENHSGGRFMTANMGFRKPFFDSAGGFNESFGFWREDTELAFRAMEAGKVVFAKKAVVYHPLRKEPWQNVFRYLSFLRNEWLLRSLHPKKFAQYVLPEVKKDLLKAAAIWFAFGFVILTFAIGFYEYSLVVLLALLISTFVIFYLRRDFAKPKLVDQFFYAFLVLCKYLMYPFFLVYGFFDALRVKK